MYHFPVGQIYKVDTIIENLELNSSIKNPTLRRNIAYTFQFTDVVDWLLKETDISLTAREQVIKYGIIAVNSIIEGVVIDYLCRCPKLEPSKKTLKNIDKLANKKIPVPCQIRDSLKRAHKRREAIHLHLCKDSLEYKKYKDSDYSESLSSVIDFLNWMKDKLEPVDCKINTIHF